jgi:hypothetical protein
LVLFVKAGKSTLTNKTNAELTAWTRTWLGDPLSSAAADIIADGLRIVQEHVGMELLATTHLTDWFTNPSAAAGDGSGATS